MKKVSITMDPCINCGATSPKIMATWFCSRCNKVKEKSYAKCWKKGITDWYEILKRRDAALLEARGKIRGINDQENEE